MTLNNKFDTTKPILDELSRIADENEGYLSDPDFSQAVNEFGVDEDDVIELMCDTVNYDFERTTDGWVVNKM